MSAARVVAALALVTALFAARPAAAANETDITPFLRFRGGIGYRGEFIQGQYVRDGNRVGAREEEREMTDFEARFGAWYGLETYLRFTHDNWDRVRWQDMQFSGAPFDAVERRKGISDVVVGGRFAILSEQRKTGDVSTWTVETAFSIPGSYKAYPSLNEKATESPAGTPSFEWLLKTSFSKRVRFFDPYVSFFYLHKGSASSPDEDVGTFNIADEWGTFFGTELVGFERPADDLKFSGDIGLGWRYVMNGEAPANRFLYGPDSGSNPPHVPGDNVVKEQGYVRYDMRVGFFYQLQKHVQARGHVTYALPTEHYIEAYSSDDVELRRDDPRSGANIRNKEFTEFGYGFHMLFIY